MANRHFLHLSPRCQVATARRNVLDMAHLAEDHADNPTLAEAFAKMHEIALGVKALVEASVVVTPINPDARYGLEFDEYVEVGREVKGFDHTGRYSMEELCELYQLPHDILCKIIAEFY